jgi:hypothetical protein
MDSIQNKINLRKSQILQNLNSSLEGQKVEKPKTISVEDFRDRLNKGEKFLTIGDIEKFNGEVKSKIIKAFTPDEKEAIRKSADEQLSKLQPYLVTNDEGGSLRVFS